ncbi:hypothetical protein E2C01_010996 [Portunus trituberculatus]|uniref:Uncharacterized protein n=1 Tax=Portunus trituberculatus TaxID=210409 RepID=A0A5B7D9Y6_PORTR|nr:hypothetical protein [Portunus trituberculatus]
MPWCWDTQRFLHDSVGGSSGGGGGGEYFPVERSGNTVMGKARNDTNENSTKTSSDEPNIIQPSKICRPYIPTSFCIHTTLPSCVLNPPDWHPNTPTLPCVPSPYLTSPLMPPLMLVGSVSSGSNTKRSSVQMSVT